VRRTRRSERVAESAGPSLRASSAITARWSLVDLRSRPLARDRRRDLPISAARGHCRNHRQPILRIMVAELRAAGGSIWQHAHPGHSCRRSGDLLSVHLISTSARSPGQIRRYLSSVLWRTCSGTVVGSGAAGMVTTTPDRAHVPHMQVAADPCPPPSEQHRAVRAVAPRRTVRS
jgi:hypothetical protein